MPGWVGRVLWFLFAIGISFLLLSELVKGAN